MAHFRKLPVRQVWMDFRGHGQSQPVPATQRLTIRMIGRDIEALCAFLRADSCVFLGQSMGGTIALQLAHEAPQLVKALVLLASPGRDPGLTMEPQPLMRWLWRAMIAVSEVAPTVLPALQEHSAALAGNALMMGALTEIVRFGGFNPELSKTEDIDEYLRGVLAVDPRLFFDMARDLAGFDVAKLDPPLRTPTLIVAGALDKIVPLTEAKRLASALPASQLAIVPHGSHCPHFDDPGRVNQLIQDYLIQLSVL